MIDLGKRGKQDIVIMIEDVIRFSKGPCADRRGWRYIGQHQGLHQFENRQGRIEQLSIQQVAEGFEGWDAKAGNRK